MEQINGNETIVDKSLKEVKRHGSDGFPMGVYLDDFSHFQNGYICWHWHNEVQITLIIEGDFTCQVGNEKQLLTPGDSIFINSCALHQIIPCKKSFGKLYSFIWRADMLAGNMECDLYNECIKNILDDSQKYYIYKNNNKDRAKLQATLMRIVSLYSEKQRFYKLKIYHQLTGIWMSLCDYSKENINTDSIMKLRDDERVKDAMKYMQEHFDENISLEDIARATMISRSELCKSFRRAVDTSPKEFLIQFRIRQSMSFLEKPELRIADIAEMTGFSSPSHFASSFLRYVGCTPLQYRKNM